MSTAEWKPIETAPRDGTLILLGAHRDYLERRNWFVQSAFWCIKDPFCKPWWEGYGGGYIPFEPSHWMPLPEPPK